MMTNPHSNSKLTLKDLLLRVAAPLPVDRRSLGAALASKFGCCNRTVQRRLREGFRQQFLRSSKNGRLAVTQKGRDFIAEEPSFLEPPSYRPEEPPHRGALLDELTCCGLGCCSVATATTNARCHHSSCVSDTPPIRGVVCRRPARPAIGQVREDGHRSGPRPLKSNTGDESATATLYHSFWPIMSKMPRLSNWPDRNRSFDYARSEVIQFVMHHCGIGLAMAIGIFYLAIHRGVIFFDAKSMTWAGVEGGCR